MPYQWSHSRQEPYMLLGYDISTYHHVNLGHIFMVNSRHKSDKHIYSVKLYLEYIDGKGLLSFRSQIFHVRLSPLLTHNCRLICGRGLWRMETKPIHQSQNCQVRHDTS